MECHLPYRIRQCYLPPDTSEHTHLNTSQTGRHSIYLPRRDGRLSWPRYPVTYRDGLPAHRQDTHPSTNLVVHGREPNSQPVDHESDTLTTASPRLQLKELTLINLGWSMPINQMRNDIVARIMEPANWWWWLGEYMPECQPAECRQVKNA